MIKLTSILLSAALLVTGAANADSMTKGNMEKPMEHAMAKDAVGHDGKGTMQEGALAKEEPMPEGAMMMKKDDKKMTKQHGAMMMKKDDEKMKGRQEAMMEKDGMKAMH